MRNFRDTSADYGSHGAHPESGGLRARRRSEDRADPCGNGETAIRNEAKYCGHCGTRVVDAPLPETVVAAGGTPRVS